MYTVFHRWDFDLSGDAEGWELRERDATMDAGDAGTTATRREAAILGGSAWIALDPVDLDPSELSSLRYQLGGGNSTLVLQSPRGLGIPAPIGELQIRATVLNLSPTTELFADTVTSAGVRVPGRRIGSLLSDHKEWQEVVIPLVVGSDVDRVQIRFVSRTRGDLWFDAIEVVDAPPLPAPAVPDLSSVAVVPGIDIPGIDADGFADAFRVLQEALVVDVPLGGMSRPVLNPGGYYAGPYWWELDGALAAGGAKWADPVFAEESMRGFRDAQRQNPDGRIDLWSPAAIRGQVGDLASLPALLEVGASIARRSSDRDLRGEIHDLLDRYLGWFLRPHKRDVRTGLVSSVFEETFGEVHPSVAFDRTVPGGSPLTIAPVDLNVALARGALDLAALADALERPEDAARHLARFAELDSAIHTHLWDDDLGAYLNYDLVSGRRRPHVLVTTFDPLVLGTVPADRLERLIARLTDPAEFNWGRVPLTSLAMTDERYEEALGVYDGRAWFGDVWTLRNLVVIRGLRTAGRPDLAAELAWATITAFHANYWEFLAPSSGDGHGADRYAWTAAQYIQAVVEHLFGIEVDAIDGVIRVRPHIPPALVGRTLSIDRLALPGGGRLSVVVESRDGGDAEIRAHVEGDARGLDVDAALPERAV